MLRRLEDTCERLETPQGGGTLVWRRWGSGPALVLLHGGSGSWRHWIKTIPAFCQSHSLYVPDLPGLGDSSDVAGPVSLARIASFVAAGIRTLLPGEEPFQLAGFSFGAAVAGQVAGQLRDQVEGLVLVGPGALGLPRAAIKLEKWRHESQAQAIRDIHRTNLERLMIFDSGKIDNLAVEIQQQNAIRARLKSRELTGPDALARALRLFVPEKFGVIFGERDAVVGGHMHERQALMLKIQPAVKFRVVQEAGHWVAYEAPQVFNDILSDMLAR